MLSKRLFNLYLILFKDVLCASVSFTVSIFAQKD
uniref:Uncharacterized protein n=1 Tax=Anguilla anguilla TaxID=7936 RepID=A0A0E9XD59_ANGAN